MKEKFFGSIWNGVYVEEGNLTQAIFLLRRTLGRREDGGEYIETLFRRGYRLSAVFEPTLPETPFSGAEPADPKDDPQHGVPLDCVTESIAGNPTEAETRTEADPRTEPTSLEPPALVAGAAARPAWTRYAVRLAVLALVGVASWFVLESRQRPHFLGAVRLTNDGVYKEALAPLLTDGSRLYFTEIEGNRNVLAQVSVWGGSTTRADGPSANSTAAAWSRFHPGILFDSTWEASAEQPLMLASEGGGEGRRIGDVRGHGAAWSPDGSHLAITSAHEVWITDENGESKRRLARVEGVPYWPAWSPDGTRLRFSMDRGGAGQSLWEVAVDATSDPQPVPVQGEHAGQACCGQWSPDGRWFVYVVQSLRSSSLWLLQDSGWLKGRQFEIATGPLDYWRSPLISADGRHIFAVGEQARGAAVWFDAQNQQWKEVKHAPSVDMVSYSPDGQWMAYSLLPEGSVWRSRTDGSGRMQLSATSELGRFPHWSPDGGRLLYMGSFPGQPWQLREVAVTGGIPRTILPEPISQGAGTYSPDGKKVAFGPVIAYGVDATRSPGIRIVDLGTGKMDTLPDSRGLWIARWSPGGRWVAAASADRQRVLLFDCESRRWTTLSELGVNDMVWSHDGKTLFFDTHSGVEGAVFRVDMESRSVQKVTDLAGVQRTGFAGWRLGITADDHVIIVRQAGIMEVYRLDINTL